MHRTHNTTHKTPGQEKRTNQGTNLPTNQTNERKNKRTAMGASSLSSPSLSSFRLVAVVLVLAVAFLPTRIAGLSCSSTPSTLVPRSLVNKKKKNKDKTTTPLSLSDQCYSTADIDYSAANEYLEEQYEDKIPRPYFPHSKQTEPIYNGRDGVWTPPPPTSAAEKDNDDLRLEPPTLKGCGFTLAHLPANDVVQDWNDKRELRQHYIPILRRYLYDVYDKENILHLSFYNQIGRAHV